MLFYKNRKGLSEIIAFILLTFLIVTGSTLVFYFVKDYVDEEVFKIDHMKMQDNMKNINMNIGRIKNVDSSDFSFSLSFNTGLLYFQEGMMKYYSLMDFNGIDYCFNSICHVGIIGKEMMYFNMSSDYVFEPELKLTPGNYLITLRNNKNEKKIHVTIK